MVSAAEKACIKMTESRNRLHAAVDALKQDVRYDLVHSRRRARKYAAVARHACEAKVALKPFHAVAAALVAGFLSGRWLSRRTHKADCCA